MRIFHADLVARGPESQRDREAAPAEGNAGVQRERAIATLEAEDRLEARAIHPAGRSRVPGPPAPTRVGGVRVDVRRHHVRLHLVSRHVRGRARVIDGVQQVEQLDRLVAAAELGNRHHHPRGGVRVLAAVLAHAG